MSADEIRKLAEDCEKEAKHIDEDAGVAFSNGDLRMKEVFDAISRTERQKASALLTYAAMVERCEEVRKERPMERTDNTVTIDAAWFAELWKIANEADKVCEDCVREKCGECKVVKERDELKAKLANVIKDCVQFERVSETLKIVGKELENERADKLKVIKELDEVRELNRRCCDENEELKAKLEEMSKRDAVAVSDSRLAAAERCIKKYMESSYKAICDIIREYREKPEAEWYGS